MTTIAIIGSGIAGQTLIYTLAKEGKKYSKILVFDSDIFAPTCALRSTAIVAGRGVSPGHSDLGDLLFSSFKSFAEHASEDKPEGVFSIKQYTGVKTKLETFQKRYPQGVFTSSFSHIKLNSEFYLATEDAYLIHPETYLSWLRKHDPTEVSRINSFVTSVEKATDGLIIQTVDQEKFRVDKVVLAGGNYNRYWKGLSDSKKLQSTNAVHGSYLEFEADLEYPSFSLTLEGNNLIYNHDFKKLIIGSTTETNILQLPMEKSLKEIYDFLKGQVIISLPSFETGKMIIGLREKSSKRMPYLFEENNIVFFGGLYKNGYSLPIHMSKELIMML